MYPGKTTNLPQVTDKLNRKILYIWPYVPRFHLCLMVCSYSKRILVEEFQRCRFESCERKNKVTAAKILFKKRLVCTELEIYVFFMNSIAVVFHYIKCAFDKEIIIFAKTEKTERIFKNEQYRDTSNDGHKTQNEERQSRKHRRLTRRETRTPYHKHSGYERRCISNNLKQNWIGHKSTKKRRQASILSKRNVHL